MIVPGMENFSTREIFRSYPAGRQAALNNISSLLIVVCLMVPVLQGCAGVVVAGAAAGASMVADRRTAGTIVEDQVIELKASQVIHDDEALSESIHVNVISFNNIVLLVGEAPRESLRNEVVAAVRPVEKIRRVHNEIVIANPTPISVRGNDTLITGRVKSALLAAKGINPVHVKVITNNGTVYLMGIVTRSEAGFATDIIRRVDGVQRVVKIFEYLD